MTEPVDVDWDSVLRQLVQNVQLYTQNHSSPVDDAKERPDDPLRPVLAFVEQVLRSPSVSSHIRGSLSSRFQLTFLPSCVGDAMARFLPAEQLQSLVKYMKAHMDTLIFRAFKDSAHFYIHMTSAVKDARMYSLQCALHKRYPLLASEGYASLSRPPVFYLTEGCAIFNSLDRYVWDLYLTRRSFRVIPLREVSYVDHGAQSGDSSVGTSAADDCEPSQAQTSQDRGRPGNAWPAFAMDLELLERELEIDQMEGRLPCGIIATFGSSADRPYQSDDLVALRHICDQHGLWLHVEGTSLLLAAAAGGDSPAATHGLPSPFECANSVVVEPQEWFQLPASMAPDNSGPAAYRSAGVGSFNLGLTFLRSSKTHSLHHRHLVPPPVPFSHADFTALFQLWWLLVAQQRIVTDEAQMDSIGDDQMRKETRQHMHTFLGIPFVPSGRQDVQFGTMTPRRWEKAGSALLQAPRSPGPYEQGEWFLSRYVRKHLQVARYLQQSLLGQPGLRVLLGPGPDHPHVVLFQVCCPDSLGLPLSELNLDTNSLNEYLFAKLRMKSAAALAAHSRERPTGSSDSLSVHSFTPKSMSSHGDGTDDLWDDSNRHRLSSLAPLVLPLSQIVYDDRVGFLFHPLAGGSSLGSHAASNSLNSVTEDATEAHQVQEHTIGVRAGVMAGGPPPVSFAAVDGVVRALSSEMVFLERAAKARRQLQHVLQDTDELRYVPPQHFNEFVGVGAFQFVPAFSVPPVHARALNVHLAELLCRLRPSLYKASVTAKAGMCIVVQADESLSDTPELTVSRIVNEVLRVAAKMELPAEVVDGLAQVVVKGIREAETKLQESNAAAYTPDRLLRQVPLVGRVWDWISPSDALSGKHTAVGTDGRPRATGCSHTFDIRSQSLTSHVPVVAKPAVVQAAAPRLEASSQPSACAATPARPPHWPQEEEEDDSKLKVHIQTQ